MPSRYQHTEEYDTKDWELKVNTESDESKRVWGPT